MSASSVTWLHTPEIITTEARGTGHSACNAMARVGAGVCPFMVNSGSVQAIGWGMAVVGGIVVFAVYLLPEKLEGSEEMGSKRRREEDDGMELKSLSL